MRTRCANVKGSLKSPRRSPDSFQPSGRKSPGEMTSLTIDYHREILKYLTKQPPTAAASARGHQEVHRAAPQLITRVWNDRTRTGNEIILQNNDCAANLKIQALASTPIEEHSDQHALVFSTLVLKNWEGRVRVTYHSNARVATRATDVGKAHTVKSLLCSRFLSSPTRKFPRTRQKLNTHSQDSTALFCFFL